MLDEMHKTVDGKESNEAKTIPALDTFPSCKHHPHQVLDMFCKHECCNWQTKVEEYMEKIEKLVKTSEGVIEDAERTISESESQLDKVLQQIDNIIQDLNTTKTMSLQEYKNIRCKQDELIMKFRNTFYYGYRLMAKENPYQYITNMKKMQSMVEENNREEVETFQFITDIRYPTLSKLQTHRWGYKELEYLSCILHFI